LMQKTERAPEGARSTYTLPALERIADAERHVGKIGAQRNAGYGAVVVVVRGYAIFQQRPDDVHKCLPVEPVARADGPHGGAEAGGAAAPGRDRAFALACLEELRGETPRSEATVPTDGIVRMLAGRGLDGRRGGCDL